MTRHGQALFAVATLVAHLAVTVASAIDFNLFKTDAEMDRWLRDNSATYARIAAEIKARKDIHGYRFASKKDDPRGMVLWSVSSGGMR